MTELVGVLSACSAVVGHVAYIWQMKAGKALPNPASWTIWTISGWVALAAYLELNHLAWLASGIFANTVSNMVTYAYALRKGKFSMPCWAEWVLILLDLVAITVLTVYQNAKGANLLLALAFAVSSWPTLQQLRKNPQPKTWFPWLCWTLAHTFTVTNVISNWGGKLESLAVPGVFVLTNGWIMWLSTQRKEMKNA